MSVLHHVVRTMHCEQRSQRWAKVASAIFMVLALLAVPQAGRAQNTINPFEIKGHVDTTMGKLILQSADGAFMWWFDVRMFFDGAFYNENKNALHNGVEIRRGRFAVNTTLWKVWLAQLDVDYADNALSVKDAWMSYSPSSNSFIKVGNFKAPFSLEELTSSLNEELFERSVDDAFAIGRRIGIGYTAWGQQWQASAGVFGEALGNVDPANGIDGGMAAAARVTYAPILEDRSVVHVGVDAGYETPDASTPNTMRIRTRPETDISRARFITTGNIGLVKNTLLYDGEAAAVFGPLMVQGEYTTAQLNRTVATSPTLNFSGAYAFVGYVLTGESHAYEVSQGEFQRLVPKGEFGAIELLLRASTINLNSGSVKGGKANEYAAEVDWYFTENTRFYLNFSYVNNDDNATGGGVYLGNDDFEIIQFRFAVQF